jgi:hypothetical protein
MKKTIEEKILIEYTIGIFTVKKANMCSQSLSGKDEKEKPHSWNKCVRKYIKLLRAKYEK